MNAKLRMELLEVVEKLNGTVTTDETLSEDMALNILSDFRDDVRQELKEEIAAL